MTRTLVPFAATVAVTALLVSGCSSGTNGAPAPPAIGDASRVDMCTILTDAELTELGIDLNSRKYRDELGLAGCQWRSKQFTLALKRDEETVAEYVARRDDPAFTSFRENTVNDRAGVQFSVDPDRTDCAQFIDGGSVSLTIAVAPSGFVEDRTNFDSCGRALRIAELIEPRLPQGDR